MPSVGFKHSEESKRRISLSCKKSSTLQHVRNAGVKAGERWADSIVRKRRVEGMKLAWKRKERRENHRKAMESSWRRKEVRAKHSAGLRRAWKSEKIREGWIKGHSEALSTTSMKKNFSLEMKRRWKEGIFDGTSVNATTFGPSGAQKILFTKLKEAGLKGLRLEYRLTRYSLDIAHLPTKTDIESDGKPYFHRDASHDRTRDRAIRGLGWKVIRVILRRKKDAEKYDISKLVRLLKKRG